MSDNYFKESAKVFHDLRIHQIFYPKNMTAFKLKHGITISTPHLIRLFSNFKFLALEYNTNKVLLETNKLKQIRKFLDCRIKVKNG